MIREEITRPCATCGKEMIRRATKRHREQERWFCSFSCRGKSTINKAGAARHGKPSLASRARENGIPERSVYQRIERGWSEERATTEPINPKAPDRSAIKLDARIERMILRLVALLEQKAKLDKV